MFGALCMKARNGKAAVMFKQSLYSFVALTRE